MYESVTILSSTIISSRFNAFPMPNPNNLNSVVPIKYSHSILYLSFSRLRIICNHIFISAIMFHFCLFWEAETKRVLLSTGSLSQTLTTARTGPGQKPRTKSISHIPHVCVWQEPNYLSHQNCIPGSNTGRMLQPKIKPWYSDVGCRHLKCQANHPVILFLMFVSSISSDQVPCRKETLW